MMRVDGTVMTARPEEMPAAARELEELGYDGVFTAETSHDPFLPITLAALETGEIRVVHHLDPGGLEVDQRRVDGALGGGTAHQ